MDKLKNLKENIFGENNKHASDSIDFSVKPQQAQKNKLQLNPNQKEIKEKNVIKPLSDVGTNNIKKEKAKSDSDPLSYSTYNKNTLKNISDPLTQMKPNSTFGYPTKKKETNTKENKDKEKNTNKNVTNNTTTGNQKTKEAVMTGLFGDYSNININKNKINNNNNTNNTNTVTPNQNIINNTMIANNLQLYMNLINMQNALNQQNMILNSNNQHIQNIQNTNNINQNINTTKPVLTNKNVTVKKSNNVITNTERNELGQVYKIGDFYSDTNLIREKLGIMKTETIKDISRATLNVPDKIYLGVLVLTDFRLIYKMENEKYLNNNYSEDYFKIPLFLISKVEKVQDKKMSFNAIPIEITLKDTRIIKFHLYDLQRFYYNLCDLTSPLDYKQFFDFAKKYNRIKFQNKNITNGWKIYDPIIEFSRQGVTEDNDLGLRYCYINKNFEICETYPEFLIEPKEISDEDIKQIARYRSKGRIPIFSYYYSGNVNTGLKVTPSIWRSAQNKRGLVSNKSCPADVRLLNCISKLGDKNGKIYIYDCRPKLNAFVNRVGGGGYEKEGDYDNATLYFCEIDNIHKARKALNSMYSLCLSNKINDYNNFWTNLEQSGWFQFIYLMLKNANEISKTLQNNHSVLIHCSDGWDRTAQLSSLSQLLLDPFYRTINGFAILIEKDWLSFGHQFGLRNGFADKEKQDQASPIFLQFLDAVHQLLEQFPNAFEFNEKFLLFLAKNYGLNLYGTFLYNNEKQRKVENAKFETASVWTEIFYDLNPYLNIYYDPNSVKILEPNYSYYNLKLWTALFMENNIYLENKHFYVSESDKSLTFKSKQEFYAYKKKEDENKFINNQTKYDELLKATAEIYFYTKDNQELYDNLSKDTKKLINELKPEFEKTNKNRIMKKELVEKKEEKKEKEIVIDTPKENKEKQTENEINDKKEEIKKEEIKKEEEKKNEEDTINKDNKENESIENKEKENENKEKEDNEKKETDNKEKEEKEKENENKEDKSNNEEKTNI